MKRQIVNIINFIRGEEPRLPMDLVTPVKEQIKLLKQYDLKGTFLIQYDALLDPVYIDLLKNAMNDKIEIGVWLEVVEQLATKAGCTWKGRYSWDWHAHCGFTVGYTRDERRRIVDVLMEEFKDVFGFYPRSLGSWAYDAYTLSYASEKYGVDAFCNCKEQWGTDGYTFWGGYYNQGYYPSKSNMLCPAQSDDMQINTPVFRMLGSDPIYQYDFGLDLHAGATAVQGVVTLEPVYAGSNGGGGVFEWVDWYLKENFNGKCLNFAYTQVGQENSFGWGAMHKGLTYQIEKISQMQKEGSIEIETLAETGVWFKSQYKQTPPTTIVAESDWKEEGHKSVWYNCKNYRLNLYIENNTFWIRDMYLFNEKYAERYLNDVCTSESMQFDNLPVIDGNRFSGSGIRAGIYPVLGDSAYTFDDMTYSEEKGEAVIRFKGSSDITITLSEDMVRINSSDNRLKFLFKYNTIHEAYVTVDTMFMKYNNFEYQLKLNKGTFENRDTIVPTEGLTEFVIIEK